MLASDKQVQALVNLFHTGTKLTYKKGEFIIRHGETPQGVFYIEKGRVKAYDITKYGEENLLIIRKSREIFPLIWAITGQERNIIYETLTPTTVWRLDPRKYLAYLYEHTFVLPPLLDMAVEMYRIHSERIINLEYRSARERLASFLLTMYKRFGKKKAGKMIIDVPLKHQDIASSINMSRETASREMSALERKGLITTKNSIITIKNPTKLKAIIE